MEAGHRAMDLDSEEAALERNKELPHLLAQKKLYLILDLDHTLLNSARASLLGSEEQKYIMDNYFSRNISDFNPEICQGPDQLYQIHSWGYWTKLRPYVHQFLAEASKMFELYIHTMASEMYALVMADLLDPSMQYFQGRIISSHGKKHKDLDDFFGVEHATLILDDSRKAWPQHEANLLEVERYHFFSSSCKNSQLNALSLTQMESDESETEGNLAKILGVLRQVHEEFFKPSCPYVSVTQVMEKMRSRVLQGCHVYCGGLNTQDLRAYVEKQAAVLGATCHAEVDDDITHVIACDDNKEVATWAKENGRFLVHPYWVQAALHLWKHPDEKQYPLVQFPILYPSFPTVDVVSNVYEDGMDRQMPQKRKLGEEEKEEEKDGVKRTKSLYCCRTYDDVGDARRSCDFVLIV